MKKFNEAYKSIGEVAKLLNLVNSKTGSYTTYTLRFWEKEFKQIRPKIFAGKRRCLWNFNEIIKRPQRKRPESEASSTGRVFLKLSPGFSHCSSCVPT